MSPGPRLPEADEVHVWRVGVGGPAAIESLLAMLDGRERERYHRFFRPEDARHFAVAHAALRSILAAYMGRGPGDLQFKDGDYGKPRLSDAFSGDLSFNMSHSHDVVLVAVARGRPVGVDVEKVRADFPVLDVARSYFSGSEYALLRSAPAERRPELFFTLWTQKEAVIKATGKGLQIPLADVDLAVESPGQEALLDGERYSIVSLQPLPEYVGAVAVRGPRPDVIVRAWHWPQ